MQVLKLSKPVKIFGQETSEIELREPTGKDIAKIGMPYALEPSEGGAKMHMQVDAVLAYVRRLGGNVPDTVTDVFSPADVQASIAVVMGFFGDGASSPSE